MILVSACLCGVNCKYNGKNNLDERVLELVKSGKAIFACPEQLGGLTTPRAPLEIIKTIKKEDVDTNQESTANIQKLKKTSIKSVEDKNPCVIVNNNTNEEIKVINNLGENKTQNFLKGANEVLEVVKKLNIKTAILQPRSPSCGKGKIYDGTFSGTLVKGNGVLVDILIKNGVEVFTPDEFFYKYN